MSSFRSIRIPPLIARHSKPLVTRAPHLRTLSTLNTPSEIAEYLSQPSWSVKETLFPSSPPPQPTSSPTQSPSSTQPPATSPPNQQPSSPIPDSEITPAKLHHLLNLSALPLPATPEEESRLFSDLSRQLAFVRHVQSVDTNGVEPMVAVRDETAAGKVERTVGLGDSEIQEVLEEERTVGRRGRVRTMRGKRGREVEGEGNGGKKEEEGQGGGKDWKPLERANRVVGKFVAVDTARD